MRNIGIPAVLALLTAVPAAANDVTLIKQALDARYALTVTSADKKDIVTPGSVLVLKKRGLVTIGVNSHVPSLNTYRNGQIVPKNTFASQINKMNLGSWLPGTLGLGARTSQNITGNERMFVNGEKLWVTSIDVKENGIAFTLFTDAYSNGRYGAILLFPFEKGTPPAVSVAVAEVAEVFDIQPSEDARAKPEQTGVQSVSGVAPPPALAPPPPPPADPKTISMGETGDQVIADIGPPTTILRPAGKQIYVYSDMKVIFVNGKVTDIQ